LLIALDNNGKRIHPSKGALALCQICKENVRAYCGEINIDHWRHIDRNDCDTWHENETEWHRKWKNKFPLEWQEVLVRDGDVIHRADIKTPFGLVVEFQNSSISSIDVKERERFYTKMIWLINTKEFKRNFKIWSKVKALIKHIDENHNDYYYMQDEDSANISYLKETISDTNYKISANGNEIKNIEARINECKELQNNLKKTTRTFIESYFGYLSPMQNFKSELRSDINKYNEQIKNCSTSRAEKEKLLLRIKNFEKCKINGYENYSIVDHNLISSKRFGICRMIKKETMNSFFPEELKFSSIQDFQRMTRNEKYVLIIDFSSIIDEYQTVISKIDEQSVELEKELKKKKKYLKKEINTFLKLKMEKYKNKLNELKEINLNLGSILYHLNEELREVRTREEEQENKALLAIEKEKKKMKSDIMKKYKGLYGFKWKYKRKTWDFSEKPIFLDFENEIFQIIDNYTLKKFTYQDFVNAVMTDFKKND